MVTVAREGQGGARGGAKKGRQVGLWYKCPGLRGPPEGAWLDDPDGEAAEGGHGLDEWYHV